MSSPSSSSESDGSLGREDLREDNKSAAPPNTAPAAPPTDATAAVAAADSPAAPDQDHKTKAVSFFNLFFSLG